MPTDFSDYAGGDLIPAGTVAVVQANIRFGGGTDAVLRPTRNGDAEGLDLTLTVLEGPNAKRTLFWFVLVNGSTDGQKSMADSNLARLKQVIDSAKHLDPNDRSAQARAARSLNWRDFDGLRFLAEIGIEPGKDGYQDKNVVAKVITKDMAQWGGRPPIDQVAPTYGAGQASNGASAASAPAPVTRPAWAS
jgi:hypothetical protein